MLLIHICLYIRVNTVHVSTACRNIFVIMLCYKNFRTLLLAYNLIPNLSKIFATMSAVFKCRKLLFLVAPAGERRTTLFKTYSVMSNQKRRYKPGSVISLAESIIVWMCSVWFLRYVQWVWLMFSVFLNEFKREKLSMLFRDACLTLIS